jgi:Domain of unknown function (DUF5680)
MNKLAGSYSSLEVIMLDINQLHDFIIEAKANTYAGSGRPSLSYRPKSHDLQFHEDSFSYLDSYFGGTDFLGQEVVYYQHEAIWAMNYYGRILESLQITASEAGSIIKQSLSTLYQEQRFLGGFTHKTLQGTYIDTNEGNTTSFRGLEWIEKGDIRVYELVYHGGLIKD